MKRNTHKLDLVIHLKCHTTEGHVEVYKYTSLQDFLGFVRSCPVATRYDIDVSYYPRIDNSGKYFTKLDLLNAVKAFTNREELDFVKHYLNK